MQLWQKSKNVFYLPWVMNKHYNFFTFSLLPFSTFYRINFRRIANASNAACNGANIFSKIIQSSPQTVSGLRYSTFCKVAVVNPRVIIFCKTLRFNSIYGTAIFTANYELIQTFATESRHIEINCYAVFKYVGINDFWTNAS